MSLIRPNHKMRYVKGMSYGYVFVSGDAEDYTAVTDWDSSKAEMVEILSRILYSITSKDGDEPGKDMWPAETDWILHRLAKMLHVAREPKPLSYEEADALETNAHNTQHWRDHIRQASPDDWDLYWEAKIMWESRNTDNWIVMHYEGDFEKCLREEFNKRNSARRFIEKHWDDWKEMEVPIFLDYDGEPFNTDIHLIDQLLQWGKEDAEEKK